MNFFTKRLNKKGFTLAELLIVVAIIAILVAIAIPIFTNQLNKAKIARDQANVRSAKAIAINYLLDDANAGTVHLDKGPWKFNVAFEKDGTPKLSGYAENAAASDDTAVAKANAGEITYGSGTFVLVISQSDVS